MKKTVRLTESDLSKIVQRVINEQQIPKDHPINNPLWIKMISDIEGDNVETIKFIPNKMLVIDAFGTKYTITKG
jgi:antitoxin component of RelBE/YafQ-DinJ toxin-antitoxin module